MVLTLLWWPNQSEPTKQLARSAPAMQEPLKISRDAHILYAPTKGTGRRGPVVPRGPVIVLRFSNTRRSCRGIWPFSTKIGSQFLTRDLCITAFLFENEGRGCLGRRARVLMKPLKSPRNLHIFQKVDLVNAPAEGQAGAARWCPPGDMFVLLFLLCRGLHKPLFNM